MGIGTSVFLLVSGAVLAFAVNYTLGGVDLQAIGYILMLAGLVGLVITIVMVGKSDRSTEPARDPRTGAPVPDNRPRY